MEALVKCVTCAFLIVLHKNGQLGVLQENSIFCIIAIYQELSKFTSLQNLYSFSLVIWMFENSCNFCLWVFFKTLVRYGSTFYCKKKVFLFRDFCVNKYSPQKHSVKPRSEVEFGASKFQKNYF